MAAKVVRVEYPNGFVAEGTVVSDDEIDVTGPVVTLIELRDRLVVDGENREVRGIQIHFEAKPGGKPGEINPPSARLRLGFPGQ